MFTHTYCISLARRPDRWEAFEAGLPNDWPFAFPEWFPAVDGERCPPPRWWNGTAGMWGCWRSHLAVIERCLNDGIDSVLILEDDAIFAADFTPKATAFLRSVPGWDCMLYFGGQRPARADGATIINENVVRPLYVNCLHAYGLIGRATMQVVFRHLSALHEHAGQHYLDRHLWTLHQQPEFPVYCPPHWIVGQRSGFSDLTGKVRDHDEFWNHAKASK